MKRLILTALLIGTASLANAKESPTAYELLTKGTILHKYTEDDGDPVYYIAWDKTDDFYQCTLAVIDADCVFMKQGTISVP